MRLTALLIAFLVGVASATWHAWKPGTLYKYEWTGRTVAGLHQVSNQFSGILIKGQVTVQPYGDNTLSVRVLEAKYADLHANLSNGWSTYIPDGHLSYKQLPLSNKPFELKLKNGVVGNLIVDKSLPTWEVNMLKGIASQLQVDTQAENLQKSRINHLPADINQAMGVYKTMEDSVTGECETIYDISPLPTYVIQSKPMLAPMPHLRGEGQLIDIVKTMNYSNCNQHIDYHFGITGLTDWELASTQMGNLLSRSSVQRVIISGSMDRYAVQSSVTTNKIIIAPHLHNAQKGIVASRMNLTLEAIKTASETPTSMSNPRVLKNLVYNYNAATQDEKSQRYEEYNSQDSSSSSSDSSSSSSSSSSSCSSSAHSDSSDSSSQSQCSQIPNQNQKKSNRSRRSLINQKKSKQQDSNNSITSSSSSSSSSISDSDSSSSSSSKGSIEKYLQPKPSLSQAPNSPLLPYFIGYKGNSIQASHEINGIKSVQMLAQKIASELQAPNGITGQQTLTTFNIMAQIIRTMNAQQIEEAANQLYFPNSKADSKSKSDALKYFAWASFRDAVAQAGTGPSLIALKKWIQNHKVEGEIAAELIAVLPRTTRFPTKEYMKTLFDLATSSEVTKQKYLNTTAIHAFTNLIRMVQVNNDTAHNRFPIHSFGRPISKKEQQAIKNEYIPYLAKQLRDAVKEGDSHKVQIYIRALGNTAHPLVLKVFEPFLEGKESMSTFQRFMIVASMDYMTKVYPNIVRPILYQIYQNAGESSQVRVAAVMQLMKTNPPAEMLQRMAQYTNSEHSKQVNSAVKSAIETAAQMTSPDYNELSMNAKSAVNLLTPRQYGFQYSKNYLRSYVTEQFKLSYSLTTTSIQSEDSVIPNSLFYNLRKNIGGFMEQPLQLSYSTSSISEVLSLFNDQFADHKSKSNTHEKKQGSDSSSSNWTRNKISKMLNIQLDEADQVEGNVFVSWAGGKRFFAFDNHTIEQLPSMVKEAASTLRDGQTFNYTKMYNQHDIKIGFPTAMGFPFVYSLQVPSLMSLGGEVQMKTHPELSIGSNDEIKYPDTLNFTSETQITFASKTQSKLGFVTPFNHQHYLAGYDSNMQIHLPLRLKIDIDVKNSKIWANCQPIQPNRYQKIAEYSTMAYTTMHDILHLSPPQLDDNAKIAHIRPIQRFEITSGQQNTGFAFDLKAETEEKHFDYAYFINGAKMHDFMSAFLYYNKEQSIKPYTNYTLAFNPHKTNAKAALIAINYESSVRTNHGSGESDRNNAMPSNPSNNLKRIQQLLERAGDDIQDSFSQAVDVSIGFSGENHLEYVATAAYGRSLVSQKSRYLLFMSKTPATVNQDNRPYQIAIDIEGKIPRVPLIHFRKAVEANPSSTYSAVINFGESMESGETIKFKTDLKQSKEYIDLLEESPMASECEEQMLKGNNILPACRNVTARANLLNKYTMSAEYSKVPVVFRNIIYNAYSLVREAAYPYVSENILKKNPDGMIELEVDFSSDLQSVNISVNTPVYSSQLVDLRVGYFSKAVSVVHPEYSLIQRLGQWGLLSQQYPTCVIDKSQSTTFDNMTYPIFLGKCWHVIAHSTPKPQYGSNGDAESTEYYKGISVLVRDVEKIQREVMILLGDDVINLVPYSGSAADHFLVNGKKLQVSKNQVAYYENNQGYTIVQAFKLPSGELKLYTPQHGFELIYDGLRVKLQIPNGYRGAMRGLCGTFDGEKATDFTSPKNCMLLNPFHFASTYSLVDSSCEDPAKERQHKALNAPCYRKEILLGDVISDSESQVQPKSARIIRLTNNKVKEGKASTNGVFRTLVIHRRGLRCFSNKPQLTCLGGTGGNTLLGRVPKALEFSCLPEAIAARFPMMGTGASLPAELPKELAKLNINLVENVWVPQNCGSSHPF